MKQSDIECYRINYDEAGWNEIAQKAGRDDVMPVGAASAIRCLCDEVERQAKRIAELEAALRKVDEYLANKNKMSCTGSVAPGTWKVVKEALRAKEGE